MSQLKIKNGNSWEPIPAGGMGVPSGGSSGQYLKKSSSTDYATEWEDMPEYIVDEVVSASTSCGATALTVVSKSAAKTGYTAIGVVGWYITGVGKAAVRSVFLGGNNKDGTYTGDSANVVWEIYNVGNTAQNAVCRAHILYKKL